MYKEYFGLKELPFALTPDPRFIYFTPSHTEAMANLHFGIDSGKGLIVVTGEVGTGKTTILRWMMSRLSRAVLIAYIFNPRLTVPEFYNHISTLLDVKQWEDKSELLFTLGNVLESRHSRGLRTVLIIDEAQGLSTSVLEEIRLLSNFESNSAKLLQIVLSGQPELREVLNNPDLRQLKQRIALRCEIKPLPNAKETERYIISRLLAAGAEQTDIFTTEAVDYLYRCSEGIPRQINNLCDNALLAAYAAGQKIIDMELIEEVAETLDMLPRSSFNKRKDFEDNDVPTQPAPIFTPAGRIELWNKGRAEEIIEKPSEEKAKAATAVTSLTSSSSEPTPVPDAEGRMTFFDWMRKERGSKSSNFQI